MPIELQRFRFAALASHPPRDSWICLGGAKKMVQRKGNWYHLLFLLLQMNVCICVAIYVWYICIYICIQYMIYIIVAAVVIVLRSSPSSFSKKQKDSKTDHCLGPKTMPKKKPRNVTQEIDENSFEKKTSCGYFCLKCWNLLFGKKKQVVITEEKIRHSRRINTKNFLHQRSCSRITEEEATESTWRGIMTASQLFSNHDGCVPKWVSSTHSTFPIWSFHDNILIDWVVLVVFPAPFISWYSWIQWFQDKLLPTCSKVISYYLDSNWRWVFKKQLEVYNEKWMAMNS